MQTVMQTHTDLLNLIADKINAMFYLEIGVYNPSHNFNKINVHFKVGVDPDPKAEATIKGTSDDYFAANKGQHKFDLIFLDGLHHSDQAKRDLVNAFQHLNPGGVIVMHDCNPPTEATTCVPRGSQREWCGDVYKVATSLISKKFTVDFDYGCMVIKTGIESPVEWKQEDGPADQVDNILIFAEEGAGDWDYFDAHREELLNLVSREEAEEIIAAW